MVDFSSLNNFKDGLASVTSYSWVLWIFVPLAALILIAVIWKMYNQKNKQWTHTLRIKRVLANNLLSKEWTVKMRRFPLIKRAEVFELQKAVLGSLLMPELESYTGINEFSIIIDNNNRIYVSKGEYFDKAKSSINVSAKHAEIDISRSDLRADYQDINAVSKKVEWKDIAKFAMMGLLIIAVMVVSIKAIGMWGENHKADAAKAAAEVEAFANLADAMETIAGAKNTDVLILDLLKQLFETENLQPTLRRSLNESLR